MAILDQDQMQTIEQMLEARERELQAEVKAVREGMMDRPQDQFLLGQDQGEDAVDRLRRGLEHVEIARDQEELRAIEEARVRIADGTYGDCIDCGREIPFDRLRAQPIASRCIDCQTRWEQTHQSTQRLTT